MGRARILGAIDAVTEAGDLLLARQLATDCGCGVRRMRESPEPSGATEKTWEPRRPTGRSKSSLPLRPGEVPPAGMATRAPSIKANETAKTGRRNVRLPPLGYAAASESLTGRPERSREPEVARLESLSASVLGGCTRAKGGSEWS